MIVSLIIATISAFSAWVSNDSFDTATSGNGNPIGITWDGTYFWIVDYADAEVYKYNSSGVYQDFSFDTATSGNGNPYGITWDGTYFWIVDYADKEVYKYENDTITEDTANAITFGMNF